jgi:hypothetical protein
MKQRGWVALAAGVAVTGAAVVPGMAGASGRHAVAGPKLTVIDPQRCYLSSPPPHGNGAFREAHVHVEGTGWTPGTRVKVGIGYFPGQVTKVVGPDGTFTAAVQVSALPPSPPRGKIVTTVPVVAETAGGLKVRSAKVNYAVRDIETFVDNVYFGSGSYEEWNYPLTLDAAGLTVGRPVFVHWVQISRGGSRGVATRDVGEATAPCGIVHYTGTVFPFRPSAAERGKTYKLQLGAKAYSVKTTLYSYGFRLYP